MARSLPPFGWLRAFESAARHLSFTAAARELGLTQSAVSQQIRSLEARLGTQLFIRKPRGLALTDNGRKLAPKVGSALQDLEDAAGDFQSASPRQTLIVATSVSISQWVLAPRLAAFQAENPGVRLRLLSTIWSDCDRADEADVGIIYGSEKQAGPGAERLSPDMLIPVAAPGVETPLAAGTLIETVGVTEGWVRWAAETGVALDVERQSVVQVDTYGLALDLCRHGVGPALVSSLIVSSALKNGLVRRVHDAAIEGPEGYFLIMRSSSELAHVFSDWLLRVVQTEL